MYGQVKLVKVFKEYTIKSVFWLTFGPDLLNHNVCGIGALAITMSATTEVVDHH